MNRSLTLVLLVLLVLAAIGLASSIPNLRFFSNDVLDVALRKPAHVVLYFTLGLLVSRLAFAHAYRATTVNLAFVGVILLLAAIALADEAHQSAVIGRESSIVDVALDCVGAFGGALVSRRSHARGSGVFPDRRDAP